MKYKSRLEVADLNHQKQHTKKILLVENDPDLNYILGEIFKDVGYEYVIYTGLMDIISEVQEQRPDLILLDYILPHVNGGELCSQLKHEVKTSCLPVIIFSASPKAFLSLGDYGCDLFIPKPFDIDDLIVQIDSLIEHQRDLTS